ncbi:MAG: DUF4388 domain-containing protein [Actinomycetota bacterium]|nr:DUF4388 domain-containing protein [Actinomycetota bacterium]
MPPEKELKGSLRDFSLPDLFQLIHYGRKSGTLNLRYNDLRGYVCFRNGKVFFATHNWKRLPLGRRLIESETITEDQLEEALDLQKTTRRGQRIGDILVELGYLSRESLEVFVEEQIREAVFHLLRWTEGEFEFDPKQIFPEEDIGLSMTTEELIMEGSRRLDEWAKIEKKVPSLESMFELTGIAKKDEANENLTDEERLVLNHVNGESTVRDMIQKSGLSALATCKALYGLVTAGLISLKGQRAQRAAQSGGLEGEIDRFQEETRRPSPEITEKAKISSETRIEENEEILEGKSGVEEIVIGDEEIHVDRRRKRWKKKHEKEPEVEVVEVEGGEEPEEAEVGSEEKSLEKVKEEEAPVIVHDETLVPEQVEESKPSSEQSLVDYYKSLAIKEASDTEKLVAFRETEEKSEKEKVESKPTIEEEAAPVKEIEIPEFEEPEDVPIEWASHLSRLKGTRGVKSKEVQKPIEVEALKEEAKEEVNEEVAESRTEEAQEVPEAVSRFMTIEQEVEAQATEEEGIFGEVTELEEPSKIETSKLELALGAEEVSGISEEVEETASMTAIDEIERLVEGVKEGRGEISREELLTYDQPTYPDIGVRHAEPIGEEEKPSKEVEVEEEHERIGGKKKKRLGKVLKFVKPEEAELEEHELEEPLMFSDVEQVVLSSKEVLASAPVLDLPIIAEPEAGSEESLISGGEVIEEEAIPLVESEYVVEPSREVIEETPSVPAEMIVSEEPMEASILEEEAISVEEVSEEQVEVARPSSEVRVEEAETASEQFDLEMEGMSALRELSSDKAVLGGAKPLIEEEEEEPPPEPEVLEKPISGPMEEEEEEEEEEEGVFSLQVGGRRGAGTSLIDLETLELEQELLEIAGRNKKKEERRPVPKEVKEAEVKKKAKRGDQNLKKRGEESNKGSIKKAIDDLKKK